MAAPSSATTGPPPVSFDLTTSPADFDLSTPAFGLTPPAFDAAPTEDTEALPTRQSLGFAAAPVTADHAGSPAGPAPDGNPGPAPATDPSYIWDLAATDVFPAASDAAVPADDAPGAGES